ncbi:MAG TPA: SIS domain-containing protein [Woeseiaceae bacterium]|nr:SIS domain-containing protein [Woeseiaceae bacterium]
MLTRIERQSGALSKAERRVAAWVFGHPRQTTEATVAGVARAAGTSEPTVIRFCRHLGLSGFRELKLRLAETLSRSTGRYVHSDVSRDDSTADVVTKIVDRAIQALLDVRGSLATAPLEEAVALMAAARQLVFCGVGASGHVAADAAHKFFRLGIPCSASSDVATMLQLAAVAEAADVFVVVSNSGETRGAVATATALRRNGAHCVAVAPAGSPLAAAAGVVIDCQPSEDTSIVTPMSSRLATLAVLDVAQVLLAMRLGEAAGQRLQHSKQALDALRRA